MKESDHTLNVLQTILDNSPENVLLLSPEFKVLFFNKVVEGTVKEYLGMDITLGEDYRKFILPEHRDLFTESFNKTKEGKTLVSVFEFKRNNARIWFESKMSPLYDSSGNMLGVCLYAKNIDSQKRLEIELENMAENFEAIIENLNKSVVLMDKEFNVLRFNKVAKERLLSSIKKEIAIGSDFREYLFPGQEAIFFKSFNEAIQGITTQLEFHVSEPEGMDLWIQSKMFPVYDRGEELMGIALFANNINDRVVAEYALKESEEKFRSIVEAAPTPIIIVDKEMNIVLCNPETENIFGYTSEELQNKNIQTLIPSRFYPDIIQYQKKYKDHPKPQKIGANRYISASKKDGQGIFIEVSLNTIQIDKENFLVVIILDITERVKAEQKIVNQLKRLEAIAWQQSHEVRRPVANILGIISLFKTVSDMTDDEKEIYLNHLLRSAEELDSVIHKIVNYANA